VMIVVSDAGVWSFRPDDDAELFAPASPRLGDETAAAAARYRVAPGHDAVFVIDPGGIVRFAHHADGALAPTLAGALAEAGRELVAAPRARRGITRREWAVTSLVAGFAIAFVPGCRRRGSKRAHGSIRIWKAAGFSCPALSACSPCW